jgi:hypothetical protein
MSAGLLYRARFVKPIAVLALIVATRSVAADDRDHSHGRLTDDAKRTCARVVASNFSSRELKLVGVVKEGRKRTVLMMGPGNVRYIVQAGECIGRERVPFDQLVRSPVIADKIVR